MLKAETLEQKIERLERDLEKEKHILSGLLVRRKSINEAVDAQEMLIGRMEGAILKAKGISKNDWG